MITELKAEERPAWCWQDKMAAQGERSEGED